MTRVRDLMSTHYCTVYTVKTMYMKHAVKMKEESMD